MLRRIPQAVSHKLVFTRHLPKSKLQGTVTWYRLILRCVQNRKEKEKLLLGKSNNRKRKLCLMMLKVVCVCVHVCCVCVCVYMCVCVCERVCECDVIKGMNSDRWVESPALKTAAKSAQRAATPNTTE